MIDLYSYNRIRYGFPKPKDAALSVVYLRTERARQQADAVKRDFEVIRLNRDKEAFLIKHFLVEVFSGYQRRVAAQYLTDEGAALAQYGARRHAEVEMRMRLNVVLLLLLIVALAAATATVGDMIGSNATALWLFVFVVLLVEDAVLLQPFRLWIDTALLEGAVAGTVRGLVEKFSSSAKVMLGRTQVSPSVCEMFVCSF
jgi:hypothetical protein